MATMKEQHRYHRFGISERPTNCTTGHGSVHTKRKATRGEKVATLRSEMSRKWRRKEEQPGENRATGERAEVWQLRVNHSSYFSAWPGEERAVGHAMAAAKRSRKIRLQLILWRYVWAYSSLMGMYICQCSNSTRSRARALMSVCPIYAWHWRNHPSTEGVARPERRTKQLGICVSGLRNAGPGAFMSPTSSPSSLLSTLSAPPVSQPLGHTWFMESLLSPFMSVHK